MWMEPQVVLTNSTFVPQSIQSKLELVLQKIIDLESSSSPSCSDSSLSTMCVQQRDQKRGRGLGMPNESARHPWLVCDIVWYKWDFANVPVGNQHANWRFQTANQLWRMKVTLETLRSSFPQCIILITHWRHSPMAWKFLQSAKSISNHRLIFVQDTNSTIKDEQLLPILPGSDDDNNDDAHLRGEMTEPKAAIAIQIRHTDRHRVERSKSKELPSPPSPSTSVQCSIEISHTYHYGIALLTTNTKSTFSTDWRRVVGGHPNASWMQAGNPPEITSWSSLFLLLLR